MAILTAAYNFEQTSGPFLDYSGNGFNVAVPFSFQRSSTAKNGAQAATSQLAIAGTGTSTPMTAFNTSGSRAISFWGRVGGTSVWGVRWQVSSADSGAFGIYYIDGAIIGRARRNSSNTNISVSPPALNTWAHFALSFDASTDVLTLMINGAVVGTAPIPAGEPLDNADIVDISGDGNGWIVDDLRIYSSPLTLAEAIADSNSPVGAGSFSGSVALSGEGTNTFTASTVSSSSSLALSGDSTLSCGGRITVSYTMYPGPETYPGSGSFPGLWDGLGYGGTGTLAVSGVIGFSGAVDLSGSGTLAPSSNTTVASGSVDLSGSGTLTRSGSKSASGTLALSGNGEFGPLGVAVSTQGARPLSGEGALSNAPNSMTARGSHGFSGSGTLGLTTSGTGGSDTTELDGEGALSFSARAAVSGTRAASGEGTLSSVGASVTATGSRPFTGSGTLSLSGVATVAASGSVSLSGSGTLARAGRPGTAGSIAFSSDGLQTRGGSASFERSLSLSGTGELSAVADDLTVDGALSLGGAGTVSLGGSGETVASGDVQFSGSGSLAGAATSTTAVGSVDLEGFGTLVGAGDGTTAASGEIELSGSGTQGRSGGPGAVGSISFSGTGLVSLITQITGIRGADNLSGEGSLVLVGEAVENTTGAIVLSSTGTLSLSGTTEQITELERTGSGTLTFAGSSVITGDLSASGEGTLALSGTGAEATEVSLNGEGLLSLSGSSSSALTLALAGAGTLLAQATGMVASGSLALSGSGTLVPVRRPATPIPTDVTLKALPYSIELVAQPGANHDVIVVNADGDLHTMLIVKYGDTHDVFWKTNLDLTGATVKMSLRRKAYRSGEPPYAPAAIDAFIDNAVTGTVGHTLTGTLAVADYDVEMEITLDGQRITAPSSGYELLRVEKELVV